MTLRVSDFADFFEELYGYCAFPWQMRLAQQVCEQGAFPAELNLPTGTGKTSCIDIAIFWLAYDISNSARRSAPVRIAWVIDRRLVVDDAFRRADYIAKQLETSTKPVTKSVGEALRKLAEPNAPLVVQRLRGGMPRQGDWARTPTQPTVLSSTVDQVGSRLLFRGYGVSPRMRPIHAGLLAEDCIIFLDEVHLAQPLRETLTFFEEEHHKHRRRGAIVAVTATPRESDANATTAFGLGEPDLEDPTLRVRLARTKRAKLVDLGRVPYGGAAHAKEFVEEVVRHLKEPNENKYALIVVNRVSLAREIHGELRKRASSLNADIDLLIGPNREACKTPIQDRLLSRCKAEPSEEAWVKRTGHFVVVATQCVEVGVDLDFDVLVTQVAPLDSLCQRFGRLNRMGRPIDAKASILGVTSEISASAKSDPLYGDAPRDTWQWLEENAVDGYVDFCYSALQSSTLPEKLYGPRLHAPILMPEHVRALSETNPAPPWSPEPTLYLHGTPNGAPSVNVVWRADLPGGADERVSEVVGDILTLAPPRMGEAVQLPINAIRRWMLRGSGADAVSDVEAEINDEFDPTEGGRKAWRWRGSNVERVGAREIRPSDTLVFSSKEGGCDEWGWNPNSGEPVADVGLDAAMPYFERRAVVRLHRALLAQDLQSQGVQEEELNALWERIVDILDSDAAVKEKIKQMVDQGDEALRVLPARLRVVLQDVADAGRVTIESPYGREDESRYRSGAIVVAKRQGFMGRDSTPESPSEDDILSACGCTDGQLLSEHSNDVGERARSFAVALDLSPSLIEDITLAALLHDVGKADLRFQHYLDGSPWFSDIRAKSGRVRSRSQDRRAFRESQLPYRWRHEALSVRIARSCGVFKMAHDPELVLWLIGTHHGFGRPAFPHEEERDDVKVAYYGFEGHMCVNQALEVLPSAGPQRINFDLPIVTSNGPSVADWQTMFRRLEQRYGVWGLASLEAIVRLADHRASESLEKAKAAV